MFQVSLQKSFDIPDTLLYYMDYKYLFYVFYKIKREMGEMPMRLPPL